MGNVWVYTLSKYISAFGSPSSRQVDNKRVLKQLIWDNRDNCDEEVDGSKGDYRRWIDTSAMLSDCLSKTITFCRSTETSYTGIFDMGPTEESFAIKAKKQEWRASRKEQELLQDPDS